MREPCLSTHGGAGYCLGDRWHEDGAVIICAACGAWIPDPPPTASALRHRGKARSFWAWLRDEPVIEIWEPRWPDFIGQPRKDSLWGPTTIRKWTRHEWRGARTGNVKAAPPWERDWEEPNA